MCDYIPTDTDVSEMGDFQDDYNNLLEKYNNLSNENEHLNNRQKRHFGFKSRTTRLFRVLHPPHALNRRQRHAERSLSL